MSKPDVEVTRTYHNKTNLLGMNASLIEVGNGCMAVLANVDKGDIISQLLGYGLYEDVFMATWVKYNGVMYRPGLGLVVHVDTHSENPLFGKIQQIFVLEGVTHFIVVLWNTIYFDRHFVAYCVEQSDPMILRDVTDRSNLDCQSVHFRSEYYANEQADYITMKHKPWY